MRYVLWSCLLTLAACSTMPPAQNARNEDLFAAARSCENGSLVVTGISPEGVPSSRTMSSAGDERKVFDKCYAEKSAPIWKAYCSKEPGAAGCAGR
jgi:hypothetical protein